LILDAILLQFADTHVVVEEPEYHLTLLRQQNHPIFATAQWIMLMTAWPAPPALSRCIAYYVKWHSNITEYMTPELVKRQRISFKHASMKVHTTWNIGDHSGDKNVGTGM
jgi:hypothetical protein